MLHKRMFKGIYIGLGFLFLGLGAIGVILPVLPTTPFLLAASYFFAKGSDRFNKWFQSTKLYKNHLQSFVQERAMTLKSKWCILLFASSMLCIAFIICPVIYGRIFIVAVVIYKYYYFFTKIRTIQPSKEGYVNEEQS